MDLLTSKRLPLPETGRALVPGCGRVGVHTCIDACLLLIFIQAYDAIAIARHLGLETVAIDIAPSAVEAAELYGPSLLQALRLGLTMS